MHRRAPCRDAGREALESRRDEQEQKAVAENAAGQRHGLVAHVTEHTDEHRVNAPDKGRAHGQQRADRTEVQLAHTGERHERDAGHRADKAAEKPDRQLFLVTGGFGASANARGSAVFCKNLYDGKNTRYERMDVLGEVKPERMPDWAKEKAAAFSRTIQGKDHER